MTDDLLDRATRALRATTAPSPDGLEATLARIPKRTSGVQRFRKHYRAVVWGVAATFVGLGAWAGATGRLPALAIALFDRGEPPEPRKVEQAGLESGRARTVPSTSPPKRSESESANTAGASAVAAQPDATPETSLPTRVSRRARSAESNTPPPRAEVAPLPSSSPASPASPGLGSANMDALYREAHRAHFSNEDFARSIALWDRYIAVAGSQGKMILEARYNRAIALARVGRSREAMVALLPFAEGRYGEYRRDEARSLIDALSARR